MDSFRHKFILYGQGEAKALSIPRVLYGLFLLNNWHLVLPIRNLVVWANSSYIPKA